MLENGYGILPNKVLFDDTLKPNAKLVYVFVSSLCAEKGYCWASNQYIADQFKIASSTVSALVSELVNAGYLHIELDKNGGNRVLKLADTPPEKSVPPTRNSSTPPPENPVHNNTSNKSISNNYKLKETPKALLIAQRLAVCIVDNYSFMAKKLTPKDYERWAQDIEKLHRIDGYDYELITKVMDWSQQDQFWRQNIKSGATLRKQFTTLLMQIKEKQTNNLRVIS